MRKMSRGSSGMARKAYSARKEDYKLLEEVGYGASATVRRAIFLPLNEVVAVKCLDLDRCNSNLDDIRREAQTMSLIDHPNLINAFCSFVVDHYLWVVMPFMAEGSCLHLMKIAYPDGFEEPVICSVLKEALKGLEYLHRHGHIHRDVKAGNILLDSSGTVKLGDFGVSACMFDKGGRQRTRNTFVGTPCWMAPEVLQPGSGYDFKADIWSIGITALELAHGHAPFSKYPPMKVLLMTIQNAPPGLDYDRDKKFSKSFKEMVAMCLVKDPTKRPTAEKLLKHGFFRSVKSSPEVTVKNLLHDLPPLWDRVKALQLKDAAQLALKKMPSAEEEALSQSEYKRGVSAWNFDIEDLKNQASLIQEDEEHPEIKEEDQNMGLYASEKDPSVSTTAPGKSMHKETVDFRSGVNGTDRLEARLKAKDEIIEINSSNPSFQGKLDASESARLKNDSNAVSRKNLEANQLKVDLGRKSQCHSGRVTPGSVLTNSTSDKGRISDRFDCESQVAAERHKRNTRKTPNFSGPLMLPNRASANSLSAPTDTVRSSGYRDGLEERASVQIRGRFSVTSENVDLVKDIPICTVPKRFSQGSPLKVSASVGDLLDTKQMPISQSFKDIGKLPASILVPHLQTLLQQISFQHDTIMSLLNRLQPTEHADGTSSLAAEGELPVETASLEREQQLLMKITEMQTRVSSLTDELTAAKIKHAQLQQQLNMTLRQDEHRREDKES